MTESLSSLIDINDVKPEASNYIVEIRRMMYGFGDCSEPLIESATLINEVVHREMKLLVNKACEIADRRDSEIVELEDFLFLFRRDKIKLQRLMKYLEINELKSNVAKSLQNEDSEADVNNIGEDTKKKKNVQQQFVEQIDTIGDLADAKNLIDEVKLIRNARADQITSKFDTIHYFKWHKAKTASFANRYINKFNKWIDPEGDFTISSQAIRITRYLAYETVAQIIDLVFLVRQDQNKIHGDSIDRLRLSYPNSSTYKPYQHGEGSSVKPITPGEIHEALRRYWSPQLDSLGPFHRQSMHRQHHNFLAI